MGKENSEGKYVSSISSSWRRIEETSPRQSTLRGVTGKLTGGANSVAFSIHDNRRRVQRLVLRFLVSGKSN